MNQVRITMSVKQYELLVESLKAYDPHHHAWLIERAGGNDEAWTPELVKEYEDFNDLIDLLDSETIETLTDY